MIILRDDGRALDQVRPLKIIYNSFGYAASSVIFEQGDTKVLVSVSLQDGVPFFMKGRGTGWLTAEYAMLPSATKMRVPRESTQAHRNARGVEISRIIGRCLRAISDLSVIGERTVFVDCDVLQADGGTRCACLTAAGLALLAANDVWLSSGIIRKSFLKDLLAAISVGVLNDVAYLDLTQEEDNRADADFNFVLTKAGNVVEVQGTSETTPISWEDFMHLKHLALGGISQLFAMSEVVPVPLSDSMFLADSNGKKVSCDRGVKAPLFSLGNRMQK